VRAEIPLEKHLLENQEESYVPYDSLSDVDQLQEQNTQLKADLAKFGGHTAECDSLKIYVMGWKGEYGEEQMMRDPAPVCDCGWAEVERGQGGEAKSTTL